jgi:hypothetical protein
VLLTTTKLLLFFLNSQMSLKSQWRRIDKTNVKEWKNRIDLTLKNIEEETKERTRIIPDNLWCLESRKYLIDCGLLPLNDLAKNAQDACSHEMLFWDESRYQQQVYQTKNTRRTFKGTNSPILMLKTQKTDATSRISLWAINTVDGLSFRGSAFVNNLSPNILYVRRMYTGILKNNDISGFFEFHPTPPIEYRIDPVPTITDLKKTIETKKLKKWKVSNCSFCNYSCGYLFSLTGGKLVCVRYDNGCYCMQLPPRHSSLKDLLDHIKCQTNKTVIERLKSEWNLAGIVVNR